MHVLNRQGKLISFQSSRIHLAVTKAFHAVDPSRLARGRDLAFIIGNEIQQRIQQQPDQPLSVEQIQDTIITLLNDHQEPLVSQAFQSYRQQRQAIRDQKINQKNKIIRIKYLDGFIDLPKTDLTHFWEQWGDVEIPESIWEHVFSEYSKAPTKDWDQFCLFCIELLLDRSREPSILLLCGWLRIDAQLYQTLGQSLVLHSPEVIRDSLLAQLCERYEHFLTPDTPSDLRQFVLDVLNSIELKREWSGSFSMQDILYREMSGAPINLRIAHQIDFIFSFIGLTKTQTDAQISPVNFPRKAVSFSTLKTIYALIEHKIVLFPLHFYKAIYQTHRMFINEWSIRPDDTIESLFSSLKTLSYLAKKQARISVDLSLLSPKGIPLKNSRTSKGISAIIPIFEQSYSLLQAESDNQIRFIIPAQHPDLLSLFSTLLGDSCKAQYAIKISEDQFLNEILSRNHDASQFIQMIIQMQAKHRQPSIIFEHSYLNQPLELQTLQSHWHPRLCMKAQAQEILQGFADVAINFEQLQRQSITLSAIFSALESFFSHPNFALSNKVEHPFSLLLGVSILNTPDDASLINALSEANTVLSLHPKAKKISSDQAYQSLLTSRNGYMEAQERRFPEFMLSTHPFFCLTSIPREEYIWALCCSPGVFLGPKAPSTVLHRGKVSFLSAATPITDFQQIQHIGTIQPYFLQPLATDLRDARKNNNLLSILQKVWTHGLTVIRRF